MEDIIKLYVDVVSEYLDAPEIFIRASAYHLVSSLLGRFFHCSSIPGFPKLHFRPNTWFIISSIPGRTRRSTLLNYTNSVYRDTISPYLSETLRKENGEPYGGRELRQVVMDTMIEEGTAEGLLDHFSQTQEIINEYVIVSGEFGAVLTKMNSKDYEVGVSSLLSKLYYGEGGSMRLSQRGKDARGTRYLEEGNYVTMFTGMQEPEYYLSPIMIRQGLLRRIILIYCKSSDIKSWIPPIYRRSSIYRELMDISNKILERMFDYNVQVRSILPSHLIEIDLNPQAQNLINRYAEENDKALSEEETNYRIYMQGFWEHLAKLSALNALSRGNFNPQNNLYITLEDTRSAEKFLKEATQHTRDIITNLSRIDTPIKTAREPLERIFSIISGASDGGIKRSELYRKCNMEGRFLEEMVRTLIAQERVEIILSATGGRPGTYYKVKIQ